MENNNYLKSSNILHPIDTVMKSIFLSEFIPIGMDVAEIEIDSLLESEMLKNIPIVKTVYGLAKVSLAFRDKYLLKKLLIFIETLNQGNTTKPEEIEKRKKAAKNNKRWLKKEVELITIHLDRLDELEKARITAAFYIEYISQRISWSQFRECLAIIERVFFRDFVQLLDIYDALLQDKEVKEYIKEGSGGVIMKKTDELNCDRLIAVGLVQAKRTPMYNGKIQIDYYLSELGLKFAEVLIKIKKGI